MVGQVFGYEVAVYAETGHFAEGKDSAFVSSCEGEDVFHALYWGVDGA